MKSVGVVGDARRYDWVVSLRAVETIDFMTARWAHLPYDLLETVSAGIINEVRRHLSRGLRRDQASHLRPSSGSDGHWLAMSSNGRHFG